jgi:hypothetical protein
MHLIGIGVYGIGILSNVEHLIFRFSLVLISSLTARKQAIETTICIYSNKYVYLLHVIQILTNRSFPFQKAL